MNDEAKKEASAQELGKGEVDTSTADHSRAEKVGSRDVDDTQTKEAEGSEPKNERKTNEATKRAFEGSPGDFDKEDMCLNGGRIDKILEELYKACEEEKVPCLAFVNYKLKEGPESHEVAVRGLQVAANNWMPPTFKGIMAVSENVELSAAVMRIVSDPMISLLSNMMAPRRG